MTRCVCPVCGAEPCACPAPTAAPSVARQVVGGVVLAALTAALTALLLWCGEPEGVPCGLPAVAGDEVLVVSCPVAWDEVPMDDVDAR